MGTGGVPHVQRGTEKGRDRDLHKVRPQLCRHGGRARLSQQGNAQVVVEGVRINRGDTEGKGHAPVEVHRRADGRRRRLLPRARQEPLQDDEGPRLPQGPADALRLDRRAGAGLPEAARPEPEARGRPHREEGAGRGRARGQDGACRRGRRAPRRLQDRALRLAKGADGP